MPASHGLLSVPPGQHVVHTATNFWLLLTQLMMSVATVSGSITASTSSEQLALQAPPTPPPLIDNALTNCGDDDNSRWRPVCATANDVDYVLFGSECLLRQTNREHLHSDARSGEFRPPEPDELYAPLCRAINVLVSEIACIIVTTVHYSFVLIFHSV